MPPISIAEALRAFVVLDDQLTQTDRVRMAWMRDLLIDAAERSQVIVLTCHPADYEAEHHSVDLGVELPRTDPSSPASLP